MYAVGWKKSWEVKRFYYLDARYHCQTWNYLLHKTCFGIIRHVEQHQLHLDTATMHTRQLYSRGSVTKQ